MTYEIFWTAAGKRSMNRVPTKISDAVIEFVYTTVAENPRRVGKPLGLEFAGLCSARRGDFRVLYEIDDERHVVFIVAIRHRSDAYRRR